MFGSRLVFSQSLLSLDLIEDFLEMWDSEFRREQSERDERSSETDMPEVR